jgi:tetratricopeptide (TPR) repeat protein
VLERHRQQGAVGPLASLFGSRIEALPPPLARQLVEESLTRMLRESQYDTMGAVLAAMPDRSERDPDLRAALAMYRVRLAAVRASPEEAVSSFAAELPAMRHRAPEAYSVVSSNLRRMAATNLIERLAMVAVSDAPPSQPVFHAAANELLSLALDAKRYAAVPPALVLLRRRGMAPGDLAWQFRNVLYPTMEYADAATRTNLLSFAEAFHAGAAADPAAQAEVGRLLLDGCFVAEDYDRALRLLEGGLALRYEEWRAMTLIKVRAHRAQARGEIREAIGLFREFMTKVAPDEQFTDPVSGAQVSGRLVLGINAARIGGLWASLGDAAQSADAYREAKAHYGLALGQVAKGSLDERQVEAALKRLPAVADATAP